MLAAKAYNSLKFQMEIAKSVYLGRRIYSLGL